MPPLSGRPLLGTTADRGLVVGRRRELDRMIEAVRMGLNVLVYGESGSGLTTVLHQVMRRLARTQNAHPRFVNAAEIASAEDLVREAAAELVPTVTVVGSPSAYSKFARYGELPAGIVALVDNASTRLVQDAFGAQRDEMWAVPMTWVLSCTDRERGAVLRPPADTFFDVVIELPPLTDVESASLLRRRTTKDELPGGALRAAVGAGEGNPRSLIQAARRLVVEGVDPAVLDEAVLRRAKIADRLSRPATMLLAELVSRGPSSASDVELQEATGWTRSRLVQVFGELEEVGAVEFDETGHGGSGRPRKVYRSRF